MRSLQSTPHCDPNDPPRRRANKPPGHGTYDNDRPPIIHVISRESGEERCWVVAHSDTATCQGILAEAGPHDAMMVYSDEYRSYHGLDLPHATVNHGQHEWARDDDTDLTSPLRYLQTTTRRRVASGDKLSLIERQEIDRARDVLRLGDATQRRHAHAHLLRFLAHRI